jgi:hypothetical protein
LVRIARCLDRKGQQEPTVRKDRLVPTVQYQGRKDRLVPMVHLVPRAIRDRKDSKVRRAFKANLGLLARKGRRVCLA